MNTLDEVLHPTSYPNLMVLCAGSRVPNPSELLASTQMEDMLEMLSKRFDYIVIDSAPLNMVSDSYPVIKKTDGVLLVVYQHKSDYKELDKTMRRLEMMDCKVLGFVLNGAADKKQKTYDKYGYGYGYGYSGKSSKK